MGGLKQFVCRKGAQIEVITTNAPDPKPRKQKAFAKVPLEWCAQASKAAGCPRALVIVWLTYLAWQHKSNTFTLPNGRLGALGASRKVKLSTLDCLERAGLISITRRSRKSPIVTLLNWK
jgi:hypothetical protein